MVIIGHSVYHHTHDYGGKVCVLNGIVQLGFLKAAQELGYTNAKVIGTEGGDSAELYAAIDAFVAEGGSACMVWAGDSSAYECIANAATSG